ncbi:MAG TPA: hypothetical protein EYP00_07790 [Dehalococcoidia bacterium]|jgi:hypothetical protein|nr:hypothetical protein [Dehalococcoidia bacterium]
MEILNTLLIGMGSGLVLGVLGMILFTADKADEYPFLGLLPAGLVVMDLGVGTQVVAAGLLLMSGLFGYYLMIFIWRGRPKLFALAQGHEESAPATRAETITGKTLADFL